MAKASLASELLPNGVELLPGQDAFLCVGGATRL